jgi:hypothetical protein
MRRPAGTDPSAFGAGVSISFLPSATASFGSRTSVGGRRHRARALAASALARRGPGGRSLAPVTSSRFLVGRASRPGGAGLRPALSAAGRPLLSGAVLSHCPLRQRAPSSRARNRDIARSCVHFGRCRFTSTSACSASPTSRSSSATARNPTARNAGRLMSASSSRCSRLTAARPRRASGPLPPLAVGVAAAVPAAAVRPVRTES